MSVNKSPKLEQRKISVLFAVGIGVFPVVFSWFTLRKGHSTISRLISFFWLFVVLIVSYSPIKPPKSTTPLKVEKVIKVNVRNILSAYEMNEVSADNKYKNRLVEMTGFVDDIKKDFMDDLYITLGTGKRFEIPQVQAFFDDSMNGQLSNFRKGSRVTIVCRIDGLIMNVVANDCLIK